MDNVDNLQAQSEGDKLQATDTVNIVAKLQGMLAADIDRLGKESEKHKKIYRRGQTTVIVLSAVTTVVAGAGLAWPEQDRRIQFGVLLLAATTTAITSWLEMRRARELWQHEREMYYALSDINREVEFTKSYKTLSQQEVTDYFQRISSVLGASINKWTRIQDKKNP